MEDLAGHVGGDGLRAAVQTGVAHLGLGQISLDHVSVFFDLARKKLLSLNIDSHLTLAGGQIDLITILPIFSFCGGMSQASKSQTPAPSAISLKALATECLGEAADLPELNITELSLFAEPGQGTYSLSVLTEEDWAWDMSGRGTGPALTLQQLGFQVQKTQQGVTGGLNAAVSLGGFALNLSAQYQGRGAGWFFTGTAADPDGVPLSSFIQDAGQKLGASVPPALVQAVQDLKIDLLYASFDTALKTFQFMGDVTTTGQIPLGLKSYELAIQAAISSTVDQASGTRNLSGHLEGDLQIGKALFDAAYDFGPGAKTITGQWTSTDGTGLQFGEIAEALGLESGVSAPDGLDLGLKSASFKFLEADDQFNLSAETTHFGDAFFTAGKTQSSGWGFVFGVDFPPASRLSALPVVGKDLKAADFLTFQQAGILLATAALKDYALPSLPPLPTPAPAAQSIRKSGQGGGRSVKPIAQGTPLQVPQGMSFVAVIDLIASSGDRKTKNLHSIVAKDELVLQVTVAQTGLSLFIELAGTVGIPTGGKSKLALADPTLRIDLTTEIVFQLYGGLHFSINRAPITARARLIIDESEAQVTAAISADRSPLPPPPVVKGLHFDEFGIMMGVFFEPPGVDLGLQGQFTVGEVQTTKDDQFAFVMEVVEEIPDVLYLAFYIDELDLGQVVTLFTDAPEPSVVKSLEIIKASDLSFHWAENVVVLADGTIAQPGFGFSAGIKFLAFSAFAELEVGGSTGIQGLAEMTAIHLHNVLTITGDGQGIKRSYQQVNGQWKQVVNNQVVKERPPLPTRVQVIVPPGGPVIAFNSTKSPYLHANWQVTLFDVVKEKVDATITNNGFAFSLEFDLSGTSRSSFSIARSKA